MGYQQALADDNVALADMVWIFQNPDLRLFRSGENPPLRGTAVEVSKDEVLLYTRGTVPWYGTYPGMYIPRPISVRLATADSSALSLAAEVLSLTKMNWNDTQIDGALPITIQTARKVGHILRHLSPNAPTQGRYAYYMGLAPAFCHSHFD